MRELLENQKSPLAIQVSRYWPLDSFQSRKPFLLGMILLIFVSEGLLGRSLPEYAHIVEATQGVPCIDGLCESYTACYDMYLDQIFNLNQHTEDWGIQALIEEGGFVRVEVLAVPLSCPSVIDTENTRSLLEVFTTTSDTENYQRDKRYVSKKVGESISPRFISSMLDMDVSNRWIEPNLGSQQDLLWVMDDYKRALIRAHYWQNGFVSVVNNPLLKVVIKITRQNATITKIKVPGIDPIKMTGTIEDPVVLLGNLGCSDETSMSQINALINNDIKPGSIITLGNSTYPPPLCYTNTDFYDSYSGIFEPYLRDFKIFPVIGPLDYTTSSGSHVGTLGEQKWLSFFNKSSTNFSFSSNDVEYFVINTNNRQGPGTDPVDSPDLNKIKTWLETTVPNSTKKYQIVLGHHSPYLSGQANSVLESWDFKSMGVDMYVSSGGNFYERHDVDGIPFVNVGLGGLDKDLNNYIPQSSLVSGTHYAEEFGVLKAVTGSNMMMFQFINVNGEKIDQFYLINREDQQADRVDYYYLQNRRGIPLIDTEEFLDVWLLLGQSNAEGRCASNYCYDEFTGDEIDQLIDTYLLNEKGTFEMAKNALSRYSTVGKIQFTQSIGFGWTFAKALNADGQSFGFIVNPVGGTDLAEWMPEYEPTIANKTAYGRFSIGYGGENLFNESMRRVQQAKAKYPNLNVKGVLWAQGENDAKRINDGELNYTTEAVELIQAFRDHLDNQDLIFILSEASHRDTDCGDWCHTELNNQINAIPAEFPAGGVYVASTLGLQTFDNINVHWTHDSYRTLGLRMAEFITNPGARLADVISEDEIEWGVSLYPNPVTDKLINLQLSIPKETLMQLKLSDLNGRPVLESELLMGKGVNHTLLSVGEISGGVYILEISGGGVECSERLIIKD